MSTKKNSQLRAVGYCRTSSEGQRNNTSIPIQKEAIQRFCIFKKWKLLTHYTDESKTGSKLEGRDEFQRMTGDAGKGKFDIIVVFDITRFGRDGYLILERAKFLADTYGVYVFDTVGQFDSSPEGNTFTNFIYAGQAEYERLSIRKRTVKGRIKQAEAGLPWCGNRPFGRKYDDKKKKWYVTGRGKRMKKLLERYANGEGLQELLKHFPEFKSHVLILNFVRNSRLAGPYVANLYDPELGYKRPVPISGMPEVISEDLMERVQARMAHRRTWNKEHRRTYILTGFVKCGHCGTALTGNTNKQKKVYYRHCNSNLSKECGHFGAIPADELVDPAFDFLFRFYADEPTFNKAVADALPSQDARTEMEEERDRVRRRLAEVQKDIKCLAASLLEGVDPAVVVEQQAELLEEQQKRAHRLRELEDELVSMPDPEVFKHQAMSIRLQLLEDLQNRDWRDLSPDEIKRYLIFLFGENPKKQGHGINVRRERARWKLSFSGRMRFHHEIVNGRPVSDAMRIVADTHNKHVKRLLNRRVDLTQQT